MLTSFLLKLSQPGTNSSSSSSSSSTQWSTNTLMTVTSVSSFAAGIYICHAYQRYQRLQAMEAPKPLGIWWRTLLPPSVSSMIRRQTRTKKLRGKKMKYGADERIYHASSEWGLFLRTVGNLPYFPLITDKGMSVLKEEFVSRDGDIFLVTSPKCGTTWMQMIVVLMLLQGDISKLRYLQDMAPFLAQRFCEGHIDMETLNRSSEDDLKRIKSGTPDDGTFNFTIVDGNGRARRVFKTHDPVALLPCKDTPEGERPAHQILYVIRNPFDACVSAYHHVRSVKILDYDGPLSDFVNIFVDGRFCMGSVFDSMRDWWNQYQTWKKEDATIPNPNSCNDMPPRMVWVNYEEMKADLGTVIRRLSKELDIPLGSEETIEKIIAGASLQSMKALEGNIFKVPRKKNSATQIRKGGVGGWREALRPEEIQLMEAALKKSWGNGQASGLTIDFGRGDERTF